MTLRSVIKPGALLLVLVTILLFAGCTQPAGEATPTVTPTPTATTSPTVPATPAPDTTALKAEVTLLAATFAEEIDGTALGTVLTDGPNSTAFPTVLGQLVAFKATDPRIAYVYTLEQRNGTVRFIVDSDYSMPDGSAYLQEYPDAPVELEMPVTAPVGAGPYTDSWGTFVSGFAPVQTGLDDTIVLIGVDIRV